jgi:hypothetical protein
VRPAEPAPPQKAVLIELRRLGIVAVRPVRRVAPQVAMLEQSREQIATWLDQDQLLLTRIQEFAPKHRESRQRRARSCARSMVWTAADRPQSNSSRADSE